MRVLIVDDEPNIRRTLRVALESGGHTVREAATGAKALAMLEAEPADVALVDLRLGSESGLDLLGAMLGQSPRLAVVIITAHASIDSAIEALRRGAVDYLPKPFTPAQVRGVLERIARVRGLRDRVDDLAERVRSEVPEAELDSPDLQFRRVVELARTVAPSDAAVLLRGENGTGKGVLARALHAWSRRADGPFVTVSCPSLNPDLLESELFGHAKGAFTGAIRDAPGKVAAAEGGTLFLDEVGDLPPALQPKLLRFLQEKRYERVGETTTRTADVRIIAATNRDIEAAVASGAFREDLLYRLNVVEVALPPLRQRTDIAALADHLLAFFARQRPSGRPLTGFTPEARAALTEHAWPGNLRELRNAVERAAILAAGPEIGLADLPERVAGPRPGPSPGSNRAVEVGQAVSLERLEVEHIRRVLAASPSLDEAAKTLGIDPSTLYRKRKQYGL
jgi:NtrC-family two-component system response regulator AlgB